MSSGVYDPSERELSLQGEAGEAQGQSKGPGGLSVEFGGCLVTFLGKGRRPEVGRLPLPLL